MKILKNIRFIDLVWPHAEPLPKDYLQKHEQRLASEVAEIEGLPVDDEILSDCLTACTATLAVEETRRQGVESRLTTIMGLSSIAGTIVFGVIVALAAGTLNPASRMLRAIMALGGLYTTLQVCNAILSAVRGLERREYEAITVSDVTKHRDEAKPAYLRRRAIRCLPVHAQHELQTHAKVTQMAVAHQAIKNFIAGLCLLALLSVSFALVSPARNNDLAEQLKGDHELRELLRGPQGPPGLKGETGTAPVAAPCANRASGTPARIDNRKHKH